MRECVKTCGKRPPSSRTWKVDREVKDDSCLLRDSSHIDSVPRVKR